MNWGRETRLLSAGVSNDWDRTKDDGAHLVSWMRDPGAVLPFQMSLSPIESRCGGATPPGRALKPGVGTGTLTVNIGPPDRLSVVIPEIDIWRVANLMLTRYGDEAMLESAQHAHELAADGDRVGAATWLRITNAICQLANATAPATVH
jgi:hypothetical protein